MRKLSVAALLGVTIALGLLVVADVPHVGPRPDLEPGTVVRR